MKAIETLYKGYRFRSRLEARWAVFFDALRMKWEYEPEGYELADGSRYLPDFRMELTGGNYCWFEVKGRPPTPEELEKAQRLADESNCYVFVASGMLGPPIVRNGIIEGARIVECIPIGCIDPAHMKKEDAVALFKAMRHFCGFYEDSDGHICLDHLYTEDMEVVPGHGKAREVLKVCEGGVYGAINLGPGRRYRTKRLESAYAAARGARFEHGERPRV